MWWELRAVLKGNVGRMPQQPENQKALQSERLERAVRDKLPKLTKYKEQRGFKTALLLNTFRDQTETLMSCKINLEVDYRF